MFELGRAERYVLNYFRDPVFRDFRVLGGKRPRGSAPCLFRHNNRVQKHVIYSQTGSTRLRVTRGPQGRRARHQRRIAHPLLNEFQCQMVLQRCSTHIRALWSSPRQKTQKRATQGIKPWILTNVGPNGTARRGGTRCVIPGPPRPQA